MSEDESLAHQEAQPGDELTAAVLGTTEVAQFENLYVAYASEARRVAEAILGDPELAADAVHNGFLDALRYLLSGRPLYDPGAARRLVLRNVRWAALKVRRVRRRDTVGTDAPARAAADDGAWARAEARALCEQIVSKLRPNHQQALALHFSQGLTNIQAAQRLGVSVGVFESRLQRAILAAQRAARSNGLLGRPAVLAAAVKTHLRWPHRPRLPKPVPVVRTLASVAAATAALHIASGVIATAPAAPYDPPAPQHLRSAAPAAVQLDSIDNSVVLDALVTPSRVVLVLARGLGCGCLEMFRSTTAGASWEEAANPGDSSAAPRLDGSGRHLQWCDGAGARTLACFGHAVAGQQGDGGGAVLQVAPRRWLFFRPLSGVVCSADEGATWAPRCR